MAVLDKVIEHHPSLKIICGDQGYQEATTLHVIKALKREMMISAKIANKKASPKRWVVERAFGWLAWYRRLSKDYEKLIIFSENMIRISMIRIEVRKLVTDQTNSFISPVYRKELLIIFIFYQSPTSHFEVRMVYTVKQDFPL